MISRNKGQANEGRRFAIIRLAALALFLIPPAGSSSIACELTTGGTAVVQAVLDANTIQLDDGSKVRLIGALAPEPPSWWKEKPWPAATEAKSELEKLVLGRSFELRFASDEPRKDRHGRYLAQLFEVGSGSSTWVQQRMIAQGFALSYSLKSHEACVGKLQEAEVSARNDRAGFWRRGVFRVFPANEPAELLKRLGTYQLVTGKVVSVGKTSRWTFFNFSDDWKNDFTAVIEATNRRNFPDAFLAPDQIKDRTVIVRGWVERWNGPLIKLTHPGQLELLE